MAFCDLKPVSVFDDASGCTYIIGEVFAVYSPGSERPIIYSWDMMSSVTVTRRSMTFATAKTEYGIDNKMFSASSDYFRAVTLIECAQKSFGFPYSHEKRMFPLKSSYIETAPGKDAFFGEGEIDENDTAAAFIMMMNIKLVKILWLVAVLIMLVIFGVLHLAVGVTRDNLLYFIPISFAGGGIVALIVYIICHAIARGKFKSVADCDPATREVISFVVSRQGFAACESCVYDGHDLVPWSAVDYFVESDKMFILYKNNTATAYIPKKAFSKKNINSIADIFALMLEQR